MALELHDGRVTGSSGVAKAGLTLGIIGTGLAALGGWNGGNGILGGFGGGNNKDATIAQLTAQKYTDDRSFELYQDLVASKEDTNARINALNNQVWVMFSDLDKRSALNEQAAQLHREYDTMCRDYLYNTLNTKIDCCCEKMDIREAYEREISELADAAILSYVNSTFVSR